jgi:hypothetical protein
MISKNDILHRTFYGLSIYGLVLRDFYPGETVLSVRGYDVSLAKNPFNQGRTTLKLVKEGEWYQHSDTELPDFKGDAFDFARLHYQLEDDELFEVLNYELGLRLLKKHFHDKEPMPRAMMRESGAWKEKVGAGCELRGAGTENDAAPIVPIAIGIGGVMHGAGLPADLPADLPSGIHSGIPSVTSSGLPSDKRADAPLNKAVELPALRPAGLSAAVTPGLAGNAAENDARCSPRKLSGRDAGMENDARCVLRGTGLPSDVPADVPSGSSSAMSLGSLSGMPSDKRSDKPDKMPLVRSKDIKGNFESPFMKSMGQKLLPSKTNSPKPATQGFSNQDVPEIQSPWNTSNSASEDIIEDMTEDTSENMSAGTTTGTFAINPADMSAGQIAQPDGEAHPAPRPESPDSHRGRGPHHAPSFSLFRAPIRNIHPFKTTNLVEVYQAIRSESYRKRTERLREISVPSEARQFKSMCFDYVTFSGEFSSRCDKNLTRHSGLMTLDFDHVDNVSLLRESLLHDIFLETEMLFVSPSGEGLKWIVAIDLAETSHQEFFNAVASYIMHYYGIEIDKSGRDISRACYLPYDPEVFIHPKYLK